VPQGRGGRGSNSSPGHADHARKKSPPEESLKTSKGGRGTNSVSRLGGDFGVYWWALGKKKGKSGVAATGEKQSEKREKRNGPFSEGAFR